MEMIEQVIAYEDLSNLVQKAINKIQKNRKHPDVSSMQKSLEKVLNKPNYNGNNRQRLSYLTTSNKIEKKWKGILFHKRSNASTRTNPAKCF